MQRHGDAETRGRVSACRRNGVSAFVVSLSFSFSNYFPMHRQFITQRRRGAEIRGEEILLLVHRENFKSTFYTLHSEFYTGETILHSSFYILHWGIGSPCTADSSRRGAETQRTHKMISDKMIIILMVTGVVVNVTPHASIPFFNTDNKS